MSILEIILLSIALAMDCLTVSIACGISTHRVVRRPMAGMALAFGGFQGGMTLLGYLGISTLSSILTPIDHWVAFGLLTYLGARMIYNGMQPEEERTFNLLDARVILTMAVATSIDALAVGISFGCLYGGNLSAIWLPVGCIAITSLLFTVLGLGIGITLGKRVNWPVEILGGLVLIGIGIKVLIEHLS